MLLHITNKAIITDKPGKSGEKKPVGCSLLPPADQAQDFCHEICLSCVCFQLAVHAGTNGIRNLSVGFAA